jgi:endoglucanase
MPPTFPPFLRKPVAGAMMLVAAGAAPSHALAAPATHAPVAASASAQPATAQTIVPPLHTRGSQIVDASGARVVLQGVNWFGFETSNQVVQGLWTRDYKSMLAQIRQLGFNTIRLPFSLQALQSNTINGVDFSDGKNAALRGVTPLEAMKIIVKQAARDHLMVLLDNHSDADNGYTEPLWYGDGYSQQEWIDTWKMLARTFANQPNVIGADLKNEPHGDATWGGGGPTDWHAAAQRAGDAIQSIAPHWLIVVEGIGGSTPGQKVDAHWWGGNLEGVRYAPVRLSRPGQLVYSAHEYGPSVYQQPWFSAPNMASILRQRWEDEFGFIAKQGIAPVLIGEFGGPQVGLDSVEGRWQRQFLNYISSSYLSWTYWSLNPDSSGTGGILNNDWSTVDQSKLTLLHRAIAHQPIAYTGSGSSSGSGSNAGGGNGGGTQPSQPTRQQSSTTTTTSTTTSSATTAPAGGQPPAHPAHLTAELTIQSRWQDGYCAAISVSGPAGSLAERSVSFTLPAGTTVTQQWNGTFSATGGKITVQLPTWATTGGGTYDSSGFCVSGTGHPSAATIH